MCRMQYLPRADRPDAADLSVCIAANGVLSRLPSQHGEVSAPARAGFQYALRAAFDERAGGREWNRLLRPGGAGKRLKRAVQGALGKRHHQLQYVSPVKTGSWL